MQKNWNDASIHLSDLLKREKIHSCLISKDDTLVFQYYKNNKLEKKMHKINSCTKSITSSLVGIALEQHLIPDLSTPISEYFPSIIRDTDSRKQSITINHLLSMSAGFNWPEMSEWGGWPQMIHSPNWVKYVLERPLISSPGESMNYNSGCSQLLSAIIQITANMSAKEFADQYLFNHLKFNDYIWHEDPQGINIGGFGIHLTTQDMHKFGELHLKNGKWEKKQLISEQWIAYISEPQYLTYEHFGHYGGHWWISETSNSERFYYAMGMGGNYICVAPTKGMVITITNDTYGDTLKPLQFIRSILG
ncbi:MAG: beta-lactamase family protein [Candidatus Pristimantibacillus lignocellulolyticus]|uniref:Beta-lactamase family protein n=1 Tax=Candidatus Pristimantibacillus lignocellulolyticus TaxID=2994561 RepID=A0A9J6ZBS0_9BACL|nr:MAG: beta-lactamase family protein [Candidatus Pristimantibacillus lignocellulolyticus]